MSYCTPGLSHQPDYFIDLYRHTHTHTPTHTVGCRCVPWGQPDVWLVIPSLGTLCFSFRSEISDTKAPRSHPSGEILWDPVQLRRRARRGENLQLPVGEITRGHEESWRKEFPYILPGEGWWFQWPAFSVSVSECLCAVQSWGKKDWTWLPMTVSEIQDTLCNKCHLAAETRSSCSHRVPLEVPGREGMGEPSHKAISFPNKSWI